MCPLPRWLRRLGALGFCFFLVKGLVWLALAAFGALAVIR